MKLGKLRTLRGQIIIPALGTVGRKNIIVSDGLINLGLKVTSFQCWPVEFTNTMRVIMSYEALPSGSLSNAGDNRQFGWFEKASVTNQNQPLMLDPDHIINRDLFLQVETTQAPLPTDAVYNYIIEAQVVILDDNEAIITIIKETSQS
jgi:hypothetical protein|tara:strand:+ start:797 stop:1240 length:444 start_codon:yes stop_codon:yes gene_type:complete